MKRALLSLVLVAGAGACAVPAADARVTATAPARDGFAEVAQVLVRHCGTLDCHGNGYRNLRLYGNEGLRFADADRPLHPACTTADEVEQDYLAVIGLEPELLAQVVADGGAHPERLSLVRKGTGLEHHKGGAPLQTGQDGDMCLRSWLAGQTDREACLSALPESDCF